MNSQWLSPAAFVSPPAVFDTQPLWHPPVAGYRLPGRSVAALALLSAAVTVPLPSAAAPEHLHEPWRSPSPASLRDELRPPVGRNSIDAQIYSQFIGRNVLVIRRLTSPRRS